MYTQQIGKYCLRCSGAIRLNLKVLKLQYGCCTQTPMPSAVIIPYRLSHIMLELPQLSCRNLVVCGSMDRLAFILDLSKADEDMIVQKFESHTKYSSHTCRMYIMMLDFCRYVVRVLWSTSGNFFLTASYDKTVCVYK